MMEAENDWRNVRGQTISAKRQSIRRNYSMEYYTVKKLYTFLILIHKSFLYLYLYISSVSIRREMYIFPRLVSKGTNQKCRHIPTRQQFPRPISRRPAESLRGLKRNLHAVHAGSQERNARIFGRAQDAAQRRLVIFVLTKVQQVTRSIDWQIGTETRAHYFLFPVGWQAGISTEHACVSNGTL